MFDGSETVRDRRSAAVFDPRTFVAGPSIDS
jgi:hypothetical protein